MPFKLQIPLIRLQQSIQYEKNLEKELMEQCIQLLIRKPAKSCPLFSFIIFRVAIKRINDVFRTRIDAKRALREIMILRQCHHPNIAGLVYGWYKVVIISDLIVPSDIQTYRSLWMVQVVLILQSDF